MAFANFTTSIGQGLQLAPPLLTQVNCCEPGAEDHRETFDGTFLVSLICFSHSRIHLRCSRDRSIQCAIGPDRVAFTRSRAASPSIASAGAANRTVCLL